MARFIGRNLAGEKVTNEEELTEAIQQLATALENSLKGHPVRNAVHVFAAAEQLTEDTDYEFVRNPG